jgi:probable rRNA maturation factor
MNLALVDRWGGAGAVAAELRGEAWLRLGRLAGSIGGAAWPVDVVLVTDEAMADLNRRFRGVDGVTDVLSFSYLEAEGSGAPGLAAGTAHSPADLWCPLESESGGTIGELVLAPAFIQERCAANEWPLSLEIPLLVVHGCLHLIGWDHEELGARRAMQAAETTLLAEEGLSHPLLRRS